MPTKTVTPDQLSIRVGSLTIDFLDHHRVQVKLDGVDQSCIGLTLKLRLDQLPRVHLHLLPTVKTAPPPAVPTDSPNPA